MQKEETFGWKPNHVRPVPELSRGFYFTPSNSVPPKAHKVLYILYLVLIS